MGRSDLEHLSREELIELVLRKDVADAVGFNDKMTMADRGKLLKGKTIAIQGVGSIVHAWPRAPSRAASHASTSSIQWMRSACSGGTGTLPASHARTSSGLACTASAVSSAVQPRRSRSERTCSGDDTSLRGLKIE